MSLRPKYYEEGAIVITQFLNFSKKMNELMNEK
jgi:hypothetical protein